MTYVSQNQPVPHAQCNSMLPLGSISVTEVSNKITKVKIKTSTEIIDNNLINEDYQILFPLIVCFMSQEKATKLTRVLLHRFGDLSEVVSASHHQLLEIPLMTTSCTNMIKSLLKVSLKLQFFKLSSSPIIGNSSMLVSYLQSKIGRDKIESIHALFLNSKNYLISDECLAIGGPADVSLTCNSIMRKILKIDATAFIIAHNHPSGDPTPSQSDITITAELSEASKILGLNFHDHIIIGRGTYVSMKKMGYLNDR